LLTKLEEVHDCVAILPAMQHRVTVLERLLRALTVTVADAITLHHTSSAAPTTHPPAPAATPATTAPAASTAAAAAAARGVTRSEMRAEIPTRESGADPVM
jgi:hypothetical protein